MLLYDIIKSSQKTVYADSVKWRYFTTGGSGPPLVHLIGGLRYAETAFPYVDLFGDGFRMVVPSYPPAATMQALCAGIVRVMDEESIRRAHMFGHAFGGLVAQSMIRLYPDRVDKVVLSNTFYTQIPGLARGLAKLNMRLMPNLPDGMLITRTKAQYANLYPHDDAQWQQILDEIFDERMTAGHIRSHMHTLFDATDKILPLPVSEWGGEMLLVLSNDDPVISEKQRDYLQEAYPEATRVMFQKAGHHIVLTQPERYQEVIRGFLGG